MLILDKGEFNVRSISRDKASYFIMIYRSICGFINLLIYIQIDLYIDQSIGTT